MVVVYVVPSAIGLQRLPWAVPILEETQMLAWSAAFLLLALVWTLLASRPVGLGIGGLVLTAVVVWGTAFVFLDTRPEVPLSRRVAALSMLAGTGLAVLPLLVRTSLARASAVLALLAIPLAAAPAVMKRDSGEQAEPRSTSRRTALLPVMFTRLSPPLDSGTTTGGALLPFADGYLLVTGTGRFYRLTPDSASEGRLRITRLPIAAPPTGVLPDTLPPESFPMLRVTGMAAAASDSGTILYVAHERWDERGACVQLVLSVTTLPVAGAAGSWAQRYVAQPCVSTIPPFDWLETGGRLAKLADGSLLMTLGDYGKYDPALPDAPATGDYGKVLRIAPDGHVTTFTRGHRNPEGLLIDHQGRIWETEHGPQGGDELNLLLEGADYGWPFRTYGTEYGSLVWPLADSGMGRGPSEEPAVAFVPSIGISNLIEIRSETFARWRNDLLVASLGGRSVHRIRLAGSRVAYVESIEVGVRIRDLAEGPDGRILLWTDDHTLVALEPARDNLRQQVLFEQCALCHRTGRGPALRGVLGRRVASRDDFAFSSALKAVGGRWTAERLDAFLRDPAAFAPGTSMVFEGVADSVDRALLVRFMSAL